MPSKKDVKVIISLCLLMAFCLCFTQQISAVEIKPDREAKYFSKSKLRPFDSEILEGGMLADGMDIRRVSGHHDEPEAQIAIWMPMIEPDPVVKTKDNNLTDDALIFRNIGSTKNKFPFVVKEKATGKYYVYKNVKYHWTFEKAEDKKKLGEGNEPGTSGGSVWTPFLNLKDADGQFFEDVATKAKSEADVWDKKLFVNRHTGAFDSGVSGNKSVEGSTLFQQVGMLMTYERAEVSGITTSGPGYPEKSLGTADPIGNIPGTVSMNNAPADSAFTKVVKTNPIPDAYKETWNLTITVDGKTYNQMTDYNMVYVEDYSYPEVDESLKTPEGTTYNTVVGKYLGYSASGADGKGMVVDYNNENPDLLPTSPAITSNFTYFFGSDELYCIKNPFYDGSPSKKAVLFFYALKSNGAYGPYLGPCSPGLERDYYETHHPYWKSQKKADLDKFVADRYSNAWKADFMETWEKGVIYYTLYNNGDAVTRMDEDLNEAWKTKDTSHLSVYDDIIDELKDSSAPEAQNAIQCMKDMKNFLSSSTEGSRETTRFAAIGFNADSGRCAVGPIALENIKTQHQEKIVKQTDPGTGKQINVKKGSWTTPGKRVIMPRHFAINSIEWNDKCPCAAPKKDAKPQEMAAYYSALKNSPPDVLLSQEVSNCCGNSAPAGSMIKIHDDAGFSKPLIDVSVEDMNSGNIHKVGIPPTESMEAGSQIVCKDTKTGAIIKKYGEEGCGDDLDMAGKEWIQISKDGKETPLDKVPTDPNGADKNGVPVEDQRMKFTINPYDNIDSLTPFRGILKTEVEIEALDKNQNPTGNMEDLEYESNGELIATNKIVKDGSGMTKYELNKFDPKVNFHHIFREAGWYQFRVKAYDRASNGDLGNSRVLKFNLNILPAGFTTRSLDGRK